MTDYQGNHLSELMVGIRRVKIHLQDEEMEFAFLYSYRLYRVS